MSFQAEFLCALNVMERTLRHLVAVEASNHEADQMPLPGSPDPEERVRIERAIAEDKRRRTEEWAKAARAHACARAQVEGMVAGLQALYAECSE